MNCTRFVQELTDYLDGTLDNETRAELEEHLVWCHDCYVVCDTTKKTIQIYRDRRPYDLPEPLRLKLQAAIISKCKASKKS